MVHVVHPTVPFTDFEVGAGLRVRGALGPDHTWCGHFHCFAAETCAQVYNMGFTNAHSHCTTQHKQNSVFNQDPSTPRLACKGIHFGTLLIPTDDHWEAQHRA